jgi:large repetitive protein
VTRKRKMAAALLTAAVVVLGAGVAQAAWMATGSGAGASQAGSLGVPTGGSVGSATTNSLSLSWSAPSAGASPTGYTVLRSTSSGSGYASIASGGCSGTVNTTSCTDSGLTAGTSYYYVVAATRAAWTGANSAEFTGTTNAAATAAPVITGLKDTTSDTGSSATDGVTKNQTPVIVGTHGTNGATITVFDGSTSLGTTTVAAGAWEFTPTVALGSGSHAITAKATANSLTSAASNTLTVLVDVTAPSGLTASCAFGTGSNYSCSGGYGTASGDLSSNLSITIFLASNNSVAAAAVAPDSVTAGSWTASGSSLAKGTYYAKITQFDTAGNSTTVQSANFTRN